MRLGSIICDALGIDSAQVKRVTLTHEVFCVPRLEMERYVVVDFDGDDFVTELKTYELREVDPNVAVVDELEESMTRPRRSSCLACVVDPPPATATPDRIRQ